MADIVDIAPAAGLPDIVFGPAGTAVALLTADDPFALALFGTPQWGVYSNGAPMIVADIVTDLGYAKAYQISDYPIEGGSFASYDKVEQPFEARIRFASGGSAAVRQALIQSVEAIVGDLNLYDIVTADQVYLNANLVREEYRRAQSDAGASLLVMDVAVQEVRILADDTDASNTSDPSSADQQNNGTAQSPSATDAQGSSAIGSDYVASQGANAAFINATPVTTPTATPYDSFGGPSTPATLGGGAIGSA